jgi:hypothetical protein
MSIFDPVSDQRMYVPTIEGHLSFEEITKALSRVSYKAGWTFEPIPGTWEGHRIRIVARALMDSYHPEQTVDLGINDFIPPVRTVEELHEWLLARVHRIESHETREWFKIDGKPLHDPHKAQEGY